MFTVQVNFLGSDFSTGEAARVTWDLDPGGPPGSTLHLANGFREVSLGQVQSTAVSSEIRLWLSEV